MGAGAAGPTLRKTDPPATRVVGKPILPTAFTYCVREATTGLAGPLTAEAVVRIFERIIDEARRAERAASGRGDGPGPSIEA